VYQCTFNKGYDRTDDFREYEGRLIIQGDQSLFTMKEMGIHHSSLQDNSIDLSPDSLFTVIKDHESLSLLFQFSDFNQRSSWYADTLFPMEWEELDENKMIEGIPCRKAAADFRGRKYTAWYAPSITNSDGPWKLGGLPGLILEAYDEEKQWHVVFRSVMQCGGIDQNMFNRLIQSRLPDYRTYLSYLQKAYQRLVLSMGGSEAGSCVGCEAQPQMKLFTWEKSF
jgi:GLPGLI family protein